MQSSRTPIVEEENMAFIETIREDDASGTSAEMLDAHREQLGYVPNYARLFAHRPAVYQGWQQLKDAIAAEMDPRRYELATLAAASELRSSYCALAHGKVLADRFLDPATVQQLALDHKDAGLDEVEVAIMDLAAKVAGDTTKVTEADVQRLRDLGLSDPEIFDVVLAAAARCFFSKAVDAVGVRPDAEYCELEPGLREALTVGRPIADA
jgi:uncharacterized peroxidase-related enzyme